MDVGRGDAGQLGDPAADVGAVGVVAAGLEGGVEHPVVGRRVGAGAGHPLPAVGVGGHVGVDESAAELALAPLPREVEVLHEEAGDDHPHPVRHPALGLELAHPGVDERVPGAALGPGVEPAPRLGPVVDRERGEARLEGLGRAGGLVEEDVGVEVPPAQLATQRGGARVGAEGGQRVEHLTGVQAAELEVRRQAGGAVDVGPVPQLVVATRTVEERRQAVVGRPFARRERTGPAPTEPTGVARDPVGPRDRRGAGARDGPGRRPRHGGRR